MINLNGIATSSLESSAQSESSTEGTLGQEEFLTLMLEQIKHQDPFKPTDNGEFITQMAQFSQVTSTDAMRTSLDQFVEDQSTAQLLNAASLVGRKAMIDSNQGELAENQPVTIEYTLPIPTDTVNATVTDSAGLSVYSLDLGAAGAGSHSYSWDGTTTDGSTASPGTYSLNIQYVDSTGESVAAPVTVSVDVESVKLGVDGSGLSMATNDGREVLVSDVRKFL